MTKVLFVCLGNICRSPLAEGIFNQMIKDQNLQERISCDSCGMAAYHIGSQPDSRTVANAKENGLILNHKARRFHGSDLDNFDYVLAMDNSNYEEIGQFVEHEEHSSKISLMRRYDTEAPNTDVPDPYYGGASGFQQVYDILYRSCKKLLSEVTHER